MPGAMEADLQSALRGRKSGVGSRAFGQSKPTATRRSARTRFDDGGTHELRPVGGCCQIAACAVSGNLPCSLLHRVSPLNNEVTRFPIQLSLLRWFVVCVIVSRKRLRQRLQHSGLVIGNQATPVRQGIGFPLKPLVRGQAGVITDIVAVTVNVGDGRARYPLWIAQAG
jgi:hypothetical protein